MKFCRIALVAVLGAVPPLVMAGPSPTVVEVHRSPYDLRSICVADGTVVATTADRGRWSAPTAALAEALEQPSPPVRPRWLSPRTTGAPPCRQDAAPPRTSELDGFPVTSRARLAGVDYTATFGGGLHRSPGGRVPGGPAEILDLAVIDGHILIAYNRGLAAFDGTTVTEIRLAGPPAADITALEWVADTLWAGSFDHGLAFYRMGRWAPVPDMPGHGGAWINSLCWDGSDLWVGSAAGLGRWDPALDLIVPESDVKGGVQHINCGDREQPLVVATGAAVWTRGINRWERIDLPGEALHTAVHHRGGLWAAGLRGIMRRRGGAWERDTELNGRLPDSWITALLSDGDAVWAGTYDSGLLELDRSGRWRTVVRNAWVNPNAMELTQGGLAVGTMGDGLLLHDEEAGRWQRLTSATGLPSDDVTALCTIGDTLWVGTRAGIAEVRWLDRP